MRNPWITLRQLYATDAGKILSLHERFDELDELKWVGIDSNETHSIVDADDEGPKFAKFVVKRFILPFHPFSSWAFPSLPRAISFYDRQISLYDRQIS